MPLQGRLSRAGYSLGLSFIAGRILVLSLAKPEDRKPETLAEARRFFESAQRGKDIGKSLSRESLRNYRREDILAYYQFRAIAGESVDPDAYRSYLNAIESDNPTKEQLEALRSFASELMQHSAGDATSILRGERPYRHF